MNLRKDHYRLSTRQQPLGARERQRRQQQQQRVSQPGRDAARAQASGVDLCRLRPRGHPARATPPGRPKHRDAPCLRPPRAREQGHKGRGGTWPPTLWPGESTRESAPTRFKEGSTQRGSAPGRRGTSAAPRLPTLPRLARARQGAGPDPPGVRASQLPSSTAQPTRDAARPRRRRRVRF